MDTPAQILKRYGLQAKKSWGQCFLQEPSFVQRIAEAAELSASDTVVEIGAGLGTLTAALAAQAGHLLAVERDRDMVHVLRHEFASATNLQIVEENALNFSFAQFNTPVIVVGNLPYNISAPLIFKFLDERQHISRAVLMLQREVAERLAAAPGSKTYGAPSVLCQQHAAIRLCFHVPAGAFVPRPRVESSVIRLDFRSAPLASAPEPLFTEIVRFAFQQRRKTLRRVLVDKFGASVVENALLFSNIDGNRRGETLSVVEFAALASAIGSVKTE